MQWVFYVTVKNVMTILIDKYVLCWFHDVFGFVFLIFTDMLISSKKAYFWTSKLLLIKTHIQTAALISIMVLAIWSGWCVILSCFICLVDFTRTILTLFCLTISNVWNLRKCCKSLYHLHKMSVFIYYAENRRWVSLMHSVDSALLKLRLPCKNDDDNTT